MKQYTIKPLEWVFNNLISIKAVNCPIDLRIYKEGHLYCVYSDPSTAGPNGFISLDHAKERAQEIWERHINQYLNGMDQPKSSVFCRQDEPPNPKDGDVWVPLNQPAYKRGVFLRENGHWNFKMVMTNGN
ncbi:hypothetical protein [Niabella aurantiaca]|uniref:hypothetical protein n=1 Tax=Niabella aurantiaca TaxID=379900 RepID=UPI0003642157|nr:hypothetical protein [Niabella aurantiaca]